MSSTPPDLSSLNLDDLRRAVRVYLAHAYPDAEPPEIVHRRITWPEDRSAAELLAGPPFERANRPGEGVAPIYALRLGNARYPHMKLQVQPWPNDGGFLLSVNTHDQVNSITPDSPEAAAFRALQADNQRFKETIEEAWDREGLPTFLRYLREYIASQGRG